MCGMGVLCRQKPGTVLPVLLLGGILVLFVVFAGTGEEEAEPTGPGLTEDNPVATNEAVQIGDVSWTVSNATRANEVSDEFGSSKQGSFVIVDLSFTNEGEEQTTLDAGSLNVVDSEGRIHETDPESDIYVPQDLNIFLDQVNPGVSRDARVIFSVPPDAEGFVLRANDTGMMSEDYAYIDLGI